MEKETLEFLKKIAHGIAVQFGENCEVVVHELDDNDVEHTVVHIENGHVSGRKLGDGASQAVLRAQGSDKEQLEDRFNYQTRTGDGRVLRSSTVYVRDDKNKPIGVFSINYDTTDISVAEKIIRSLNFSNAKIQNPEKIVQNVGDLLEELIESSVKLVGKPVAVMTKEDKIKAIQYLNGAGAFLITKSSEKVSAYFGISRYTLYSYLGQTPE